MLGWACRGLVSKHKADVRSGKYRVAAPHSHAEEIRQIKHILLDQQRAWAERVPTAAPYSPGSMHPPGADRDPSASAEA